MYKNRKILGVIGARGGSKGLPGKNIKICAGKPLIQWTIEAGQECSYIDEVAVSTDDIEISEIASRLGATVPYIRPAHLATDTATIDAVILDLVRELKLSDKTFDYIVLLQPTSPLRTSKHIDAAIESYFERATSIEETLVSVAKAPQKSMWLMEKQNNDYIHFCFEQGKKKRQRQAGPVYYLPNGAIYLMPIQQIENGFYGEQTLAFIMDEFVSIDVDDVNDFELAQQRLNATMKND
jgi:CMP-N,N'-diacetyllegionaminic acid synthase